MMYYRKLNEDSCPPPSYLVWFCHQIHLVNGPGLLGAFVSKGPSFLKKYTYFTGFSSLPSSAGHDIGKQLNNVSFKSTIPAMAKKK